MRGIWLCLLAGCSMAWYLGAQQDAKKLTARELFYSAVDTPPAAPHKPAKPAAKPKAPSRKSAPPIPTRPWRAVPPTARIQMARSR